MPAKLYMPTGPSKPGALPLVVFSHGIGGSREGYSYIGKYLAANGMAALHLQHAGSDRSIWFGNPLAMVNRLQTAAKETEAIDRAKDVSFAIDQVLADKAFGPRIDAARIGAAGHSYGANTMLLVSGARVQREGRALGRSFLRGHRAEGYSAPMFSTAVRVSTLVLLGAFGASCGLLRRGTPETAFVDSRRAPLAIGRVALVNVEERFALIEANLAQSPGLGTALRAYTGNAVSAELRATGVRRRPFLVADLVSGMPAKGDLVVQPLSEATPVPGAITAQSAEAPAAEPRRKRWLGLFGGRK